MTPIAARHWPKSLLYPTVGALLALGAPAGLILVRRLVAGDFSLGGVVADVTHDPVGYAYLTTSTTIAFATFGLVLGRNADKLEASATTDSLTGLANRRYFHERVLAELKRARRYGSHVSLLLIDVDRLKRINDELGHDAGDTALRQVAEALSSSCRATDLPARWGGDEFTVLAPATTAQEALALATRIREALLRAQGSNTTTVSIGITDVAQLGDSAPEAFFANADSALYAAKAAGRDRAVLYSSDEHAPSRRMRHV